MLTLIDPILLCLSIIPSFPPCSLMKVVDDDPMIAKIHAHAEVFSPKVEFIFSYLQVRFCKQSCNRRYFVPALIHY